MLGQRTAESKAWQYFRVVLPVNKAKLRAASNAARSFALFTGKTTRKYCHALDSAVRWPNILISLGLPAELELSVVQAGVSPLFPTVLGIEFRQPSGSENVPNLLEGGGVSLSGIDAGLP